MPFDHEDGTGRRKRLVVIGISAFLLVALLVAVTVGVSLNSFSHSSTDSTDNESGSHGPSATTRAIKSMCKSTDYKQECEESLSGVGNSTSDPRKLIQAGFKAAMKKISEAAKKSAVLQELEKDPRASKALGHCKTMMDDSVEDLHRSFEKLESFDMSKLEDTMMDLKVWISATVTYQETCLDGFKNTTGEAAEKMKSALKTSMRLSSNGLAMLSEISELFSDLSLFSGSSRRLLEVPVLGHGDAETESEEWFGAGTRRLMAADAPPKADAVVAKDGSGKYSTISDALKDVPRKSNKTYVIHVKEGIYKEYVTVERNMTNVMLVGDGSDKTRITGSKNFVDGIPTSLTATVMVLGDNFKARDIGFENTAGPSKHQAVALRVNADLAVFYRCRMDAYQDTLYTHAKRQFYRDCTVSGTIDFVFGDAAVVFQNCKFIVRKPMDNQQCIVTAQGRKDRRQPSAIIIQNGTFVADSDYYPLRHTLPAYLGRPWKEFSRTVIMESYIDDLIQPKGWLPWAGDFGLRTCFYAEYDNRGPGASAKAQRAKWRGVKKVDANHATGFAPGKFFRGDWWVKRSGVPYYAGMLPASTDKKE